MEANFYCNDPEDRSFYFEVIKHEIPSGMPLPTVGENVTFWNDHPYIHFNDVKCSGTPNPMYPESASFWCRVISVDHDYYDPQNGCIRIYMQLIRALMETENE
jgi:hypothetical protein